MSKNVIMMEDKVSQSFSGVKKIQTNLVDDKTQYWVPEDEAHLYIKTKKLSVSKNGVYAIADENDGESSIKYDAYSQIKVKVPDEKYKTKSKKITANGNYQASADGVDAYSSVTVAVKGALGGKDYTFKWELVLNQGIGSDISRPIRVVECGGNIYVLIKDFPSNYYIKKFNGSSWSDLPALPAGSSNTIIGAYNNQLHLMDELNHYVWNGNSWQLLPIQNPRRTTETSHIIELQGKLHYFCGDVYTPGYFIFDGTSWVGGDNSSVGTHRTTNAVYVYNDAIHLIYSGGKDYTWNGNEFEDSDFSWGNNVVSVGNFTMNNVEKLMGVQINGNTYYRSVSYNGLFVRPEEFYGLKTGTNSDYLGALSYISSINNTIYCMTENKTFKAILVEAD